MFQDHAELYETPVGNSPMDLFGSVTKEYTRLNENPDYMIKLSNKRPFTIIVVHASGIVVEARWQKKNYMNVYIDAPGRLRGKGRLRGICGNFDGNRDNDFFDRATPEIPVTGHTNSPAVQAAVQTCELHSDIYTCIYICACTSSF